MGKETKKIETIEDRKTSKNRGVVKETNNSDYKKSVIQTVQLENLLLLLL